MVLPSLIPIALCFFLIAVQAFVGRAIIGRHAPPRKLLVYTAAATAVHLCIQPFPILIAKVVFVTAVHVALQVRIFQAPLFPDAVISISLPLSLGFSTHQILLPLLSWLLETDLSANVQQFLFFLPCLLLAPHYWLKQMLAVEGPIPREMVKRKTHRIAIIAGASFFLHVRALLNLTSKNKTARLLSTIYASAGTVLAFVVAGTLLVQLRQTERERKKADYHALKHRVQSSALRTLREERHEFLNQLALISTYLQMGEKQKAQHCIDFAAASLSQECDEPYLPEDAWLMVLEAKKQKALVRGIRFTVNIQAEPPLAFAEQRLLPKLISNLVDNAFAAALNTPLPRVDLRWEELEDGRILQVSNNGPPITPEQGRKIFQGGVTTKNNTEGTHGWGLVICQKIADELKGTLSYASTSAETTFTLRLPPADINGGEQARPHP